MAHPDNRAKISMLPSVRTETENKEQIEHATGIATNQNAIRRVGFVEAS